MSERPPLTQKRAMRCMLLNIFLLPGVGSLMGGRRSGWWQFLLLAMALMCIAPLAFEMVSQVSKIYQGISSIADSSGGDIPLNWSNLKRRMMSVLQQRGGLAFTGAALGLAAWIWAFLTGVSLLTEAAKGGGEKNNDVAKACEGKV